MANVGWANTGKIFTPHCVPVIIDCNFVIDHANGNGLGVRQLKGQGVAKVIGNSSVASNSPAAGIFQVQLGSPYNRYFGGFSGFVSPNSGSTAINALTVNLVYVIATLGTSTTANWVAAGLPIGVTPAVGVSFQALGATGSLGTGTCTSAVASNVSHIEIIGDPNSTLYPVGLAASKPYIWCQYVGATSSGSTVPIAVQPTDGTVVGMAFYFSNSTVMVAGE